MDVTTSHLTSSSGDQTDYLERSVSPGTPFQGKNIKYLTDAEENLDYLEKLAILRTYTPEFSNDLKFSPIFDTKILRRYSYLFYYYFELYKVLFKLFALLTVLALAYYIIIDILETKNDNVAGFWLFIGYSILTIIIVRVFFMRQESNLLDEQGKKISEEDDMDGEDWTENKFALLVEGLPRQATVEEIKKFFNSKLQENGCSDKVREVMMLQECAQYTFLQKKLRRKNYVTKKTFVNRENLVDKITKLQNSLTEISRSMENLEYYKGTSIVIFETVRSKITLENYFRLGRIKGMIYSCLPKFLGKRYRFQGVILKIREAPEPSDIIFERVYASRSNLAFRKLLAYFLGNLTVLAGIGVLVFIRLGHNGAEFSDQINLSLYVYITSILITTSLIYLLTDLLLEKLVINKTKSGCELGKIKYRVNISYLNINAYLVAVMYIIGNYGLFVYQIIFTGVILALVIPLRKIFAAISFQKIRLRRQIYRDPLTFEKYTQKEIIDVFSKPEFDFANNIEDSVCFLFMALGFYFVGELYLVAINLVALLISLLVDRFIIINLTSPPRIKGSEMGLEFFSILRWDIRLQMLTLAFIPNGKFSSIQLPPTLRIIFFVVFGVFLMWDFRRNLRKSWKNKWSKQREQTTYESVHRFFKHTYHEEYPFKSEEYGRTDINY